MDDQNLNPIDSREPETRHVPTEEEIARAEAAAVAALREKSGETGPSDFVPYVDDVIEETPPAPKPAVKSASTEAAPASSDDDDDDEEEYVPTAWERRIAAIPEKKWTLYQTIGGALIGAVAITVLFLGEEIATYALLIAVVLALFLPNYLERNWRRKMPRLRVAMLVSMLVCLLIFGLVVGIRTGFRFKTTE